MVDNLKGYEILLEKENRERKERMKKIFVTAKETLQYVGIIVTALLSGLFLVIKMAVTETKKYFLKIWRYMHFVRYYPAEALSEPIFRTWHFFWRMKNKK